MPSPGSTLTEVLPIHPLFAPYPRGRSRLPALKPVLVNDHSDSTPAAIRKTAYHSPSTVDLHVGFCAHHIGGKRNRKIDSRTDGHIGIHAKQDAVGGNVLGLDRLSRDSRLVACRLQCHRQ